MNKRILSLVLALVMVLGTFGTVFAASYDDVTGTDVAPAVDRLSTLGILAGYPDGTFRPDNSITRAEFAAVATRAKGLESVAQAAKGLATGFPDVTATHWASGYVGTAAKLGIVNGMGQGQFAPEADVRYEDAVTMIVRALGYEAAAQAKGGYPYGYLIVANENGLLDDVKGTQGVAATRGLVAQLTDNALEIPMMVQVGFGTDAKWVISGSKEHGDNAVEKYLLDELGFDSVKGRVVSVNTKTDKIIVDPTDEDLKNVTLEVAEGFDFYSVEGLETKFWYKNDTVEVYVVNEEAKFDAFKFIDEDEVELIVEEEEYDIAKKADGFIGITIDGEDQDDLADGALADYAKVVFNDDDEVIWAQGFTFDGFIVVEKVEDEKALSFDDFDEVDLEDFTVVKDGKTIGIDGIEKQDILFYNNDEEFAIVYNNGTEGELDRVYNNEAGFRFEGKGYTLSDISDRLYFDDGKIGELTDDILADLLDDEATITIYVDFAGKVIVVAGEVSSVGNSAFAVLTKDVNDYEGRGGSLLAIDLRNGENAKVSYDIKVADLNDDVKLEGISIAELTVLEKGEVLKLTVDKDGDVIKIERPLREEDANAFEIDDSNVKVSGVNYKLQANTVVFYDNTDEAITLGNAEGKFEEVKAGSTIYLEKGRVVAVVGTTDTDADTKNVTGLVSGVKALANGKLEFSVKVFGTTERLVTESKTLALSDFSTSYKNTIRTFKVGESSGEIKSFANTDQAILTIADRSGRTIEAVEVGISDVELNRNAKIYDAAYKEISVNDLKDGDKITVYYQGSSRRFVDYVIKAEIAAPPVIGGDLTSAEKVEALITALPAPASITLANKKAVEAARAAYNNLTVAQEADVAVTLVEKLELAEAKLVTLADDADELAEAIEEAEAALVAHIAAGGANDDPEYDAVEAALAADSQVVATIESTTDALVSATEILVDEAEELAEAVEAAEAALVAYIAAGGEETDGVYTDVEDELEADSQLAGDISTATDALVLATEVLLTADAIDAINDANTVAKMQAAFVEYAEVLELDLGIYNELSSLQKALVAQEMIENVVSAEYTLSSVIASDFATAVAGNAL